MLKCMRILNNIFICVLCCGLGCIDNANAYVFYSDLAGPRYEITENIEIKDNVRIDIENMTVADGMVRVDVVNNGYLETNFDIHNNVQLYIQNSGEMNSSFSLGDGVHVIQVVKSNDDLNSLGLESGFDVVVGGENTISLNGLLAVATGADNIELNNSRLYMDNSTMRDFKSAGAPGIKLVGTIVVHADSVAGLSGRPLLENTYGTGKVFLDIDNMNPLYAVQTKIVGGNVYADIIRETDFLKIFDNDKTGKFLNALRSKNPGDKLVVALDGAESISEMRDIMAGAVRMNPGLLMRPVRVFNRFEMDDLVFENLHGFVAEPLFVATDEMKMWGINFGGAFDVSENLNMALSAHVAEFDYVDDINDYGGVLYGGNARIRYEGDIVFARAGVGVSITDFDIDMVLVDDEIIDNPYGFSGYGVSDIGVKFSYGELNLLPFARFGIDYINLESDTDLDLFTGIGADFEIDVGTADLKYGYGVRVAGDTRGTFDAMGVIRIYSDADSAGGDVGVGVVYDDDLGLAYKISIGANFVF